MALLFAIAAGISNGGTQNGMSYCSGLDTAAGPLWIFGT
jgi:hypothetical protein